MIFVAIQFMERSEKSWRSKFMMRKHQFIYKSEQSKNGRISPYVSALFLYNYLNLANILLTVSNARTLQARARAMPSSARLSGVLLKSGPP